MIPTWVDLSREVTDTSDRVTTPAAFVREAFAELARMGVEGDRAVEAVAHCATECSWGRRAIGHNRGGVKLKEADDQAHRRKHGRGLAWWRYAGHVEAGDAPVVLYRAWDDAGSFWRFWTKRFTPLAPTHGDRYAAAGQAFWGVDPSRWIVELILAGYRGAVREGELRELVASGGDLEAHPSIATHRSVARRVRAMQGAT
ncbi:MAG: hypothetical protein Q8S73_12675 [Deltaproteobacteria bacterium]|nr:hypothetical protein [Myxococcales bacterium]MDP3214954.1 hypothetical protein [Deltaproteobacteria bacterium]